MIRFTRQLTAAVRKQHFCQEKHVVDFSRLIGRVKIAWLITDHRERGKYVKRIPRRRCKKCLLRSILSPILPPPAHSNAFSNGRACFHPRSRFNWSRFVFIDFAVYCLKSCKNWLNLADYYAPCKLFSMIRIG